MAQVLSIKKTMEELLKYINYEDLKYETIKFGADKGYKTHNIAHVMVTILALKELGIIVELDEITHPNKTPLGVLNTFASKKKTNVIWKDVNGFKQCKITIINEFNEPKVYIGLIHYNLVV
ncbi:hypothetical protein ACTFIY_008462 [Dictyostelium cf. discoideum]